MTPRPTLRIKKKKINKYYELTFSINIFLEAKLVYHIGTPIYHID